MTSPSAWKSIPSPIFKSFEFKAEKSQNTAEDDLSTSLLVATGRGNLFSTHTGNLTQNNEVNSIPNKAFCFVDSVHHQRLFHIGDVEVRRPAVLEDAHHVITRSLQHAERQGEVVRHTAGDV